MKKNVFNLRLTWIMSCMLLMTTHVLTAAKTQEPVATVATVAAVQPSAAPAGMPAVPQITQEAGTKTATTPTTAAAPVLTDDKVTSASKSLTFADLKRLAGCLDEKISDRARVLEQCFKQPLATRLYDDFIPTLQKFVDVAKGQMNNKNCWLNGIMPDPSMYQLTYNDSTRCYEHPYLFVPFVQRLTFAVGDEIAQWGDLHGGFHSLINTLSDLQTKGKLNDQLRVTDPNYYLMFLGDFVDRGMYGVEVVYTVMQLKILNPNNVILARGNHESIALNLEQGVSGGFAQELSLKLRRHGGYNQQARFIEIFYNLLPEACFINKETLACHGGLDLAYDSSTLVGQADPKIQFELITEKNYDASRLKVSAKLKKIFLQTVETHCKPILHDWHMKGVTAYDVVSKQDSEFAGNVYTMYSVCCGSDNRTFDEKDQQKYSSSLKEYGSDRTSLNAATAEFGRNSQAFQAFYTAFKKYNDSLMKLCETMIDQIRRVKNLSEPMLLKLEAYHEQLKKLKEDKDRENNVIKYFQACNFIRRRFMTIKRQIDPAVDEKVSEVKQPAENIDDIKSLMKQRIDKMRSIIDLLNKFFAPYQPTAPAGLEQMGFPWHDFIIATSGLLTIPSGGHRLAFGKILAEAIMKAQGYKVVFRAHQHTGDMVPLLKRSNGIAVLWDFSASVEKFALRQGMVCTFQVAPSSGMVDLDYDPYGLLTIGATTETSILEKIRVKRTGALQVPATVARTATVQPMASPVSHSTSRDQKTSVSTAVQGPSTASAAAVTMTAPAPAPAPLTVIATAATTLSPSNPCADR